VFVWECLISRNEEIEEVLMENSRSISRSNSSVQHFPYDFLQNPLNGLANVARNEKLLLSPGLGRAESLLSVFSPCSVVCADKYDICASLPPPPGHCNPRRFYFSIVRVI
jgi:hypothetical protein